MVSAHTDPHSNDFLENHFLDKEVKYHKKIHTYTHTHTRTHAHTNTGRQKQLKKKKARNLKESKRSDIWGSLAGRRGERHNVL